MYVATYIDRKNNVLKISERIKNERILTEYPLVLEYYLEDENGYYDGISGKKLKKMEYKYVSLTKKLSDEYKKNNINAYELNFNLTNKVLYKYYKNSELPVLHKSFFDIEVDRKGYEYLTVKELVDKACCPINAISIFNDWENKEYTLMLCPENLNYDEAKKICDKFDTTVLFKNEKDLLQGIILLFSDSDALIGWNSCIRTDSSVWLKDKIVEIKDLKEGQELYNSILKKKSNITLKEEYKLTTYINNNIYASNEHRFPVYIFKEDDNILKLGFKNKEEVLKVSDIINEQKKGNKVFVKLKQRINNNKSITYRNYIINNLDCILKNYHFNLENTNDNSMENIIDYIKNNTDIKIYNNENESLIIKLDDIIDEKIIYEIGDLYSDDKESINYKNNKFDKKDLLKLLCFDKNGNKCLNKTLLSMLSYKQFMGFLKGCINYNDLILNNKIKFSNNNDDIFKIQELLLWNGIVSSISDNLNELYIENFNKNNENIYKENNDIYVKLKDIQNTNNIVPMIDICTSTEYFYSFGIKTHNCRFDIPYIVRRIENVLGKEYTKKLNVWDIEPEFKEKIGDFGDKNITYNLIGKISIDYLDLYKKHERGKKESYKLNDIAQIELGEEKVQHDESLDDMYRQRYEDFIKYNRQDTLLVKKLDDLLQYIQAHNALCHDVCCTFDSTMGSVSWIDQSIINKAHDEGYIVDIINDSSNSPFSGIVPPGAYVPNPVKGLVNNVMSYDINSLYPSAIRSLNMSPETIVGQIELTLTIPYIYNKIQENDLYKNKSTKLIDWGAAWLNEWQTLEYDEIMNQSDTLLVLNIENKGKYELPAKDIYNYIFKDNSNLSISPLGTIFRTDKKGLVNIVLTEWINNRKQLKRKLQEYEDLEAGVEIDDELKQLLQPII